MIMLTKEKLYHKKSRSDKSGMGFSISLNFECMDFNIAELEEDENDENIEDIDILSNIKQFLKEKGESNTTQIINGLTGICGKSKVQKTLKDKKHNKIHWYCFKNPDAKNEWLFKAIDSKEPTITEFETTLSDTEIMNIFGD